MMTTQSILFAKSIQRLMRPQKSGHKPFKASQTGNGHTSFADSNFFRHTASQNLSSSALFRYLSIGVRSVNVRYCSRVSWDRHK